MADEEAGRRGALKRCDDPPSHQKRPTTYSLIRSLFLLCLLLGILGYALTSGFLKNVQVHHQEQRSFKWNDPEPGDETKRILKFTVKPNESMTEATKGILYHEGYPLNYRFIIDHKDACKTNDPYVVLMVIVGAKNVAARDAIRQTWANQMLVQDKVVLTFFMLGLSGSPDAEEVQENINQENLQHQDLIQGNFIDSYRNLTIKTMLMMHWLATRCRTAAYAMKIDSDMLLIVENLLTMLQKPNIPKTDYLTAEILWGRPVVRTKDSKWYVPEEMLSDSTYPPYPRGTAYLFSNDLPAKFVEISKSVTYVPMEDAYIGMCMKGLGLRIMLPPNPPQFQNYFMKYDRCKFSKLIFYNVESLIQMKTIWTDLRRPEPPCPEEIPEDISDGTNKEG